MLQHFNKDNDFTNRDYFQFHGQVFDIRDVISRFEELEAQGDDIEPQDALEFVQLKEFLEEVAGQGGDEDWRGQWYPVTFIRSDYFEEYAEDMVRECEFINRDLPQWIENAIDWSKIADAVMEDYSEVTIGSETYWFR